ncbi:methyl-accepting chemotaxis protein [Oscillospiraceae bacterium MB08-C2-2]|nr:methyl-accepting chemotaxis protein [Oscillospiraceae bacterium MB08-C2-2]
MEAHVNKKKKSSAVLGIRTKILAMLVSLLLITSVGFMLFANVIFSRQIEENTRDALTQISKQASLMVVSRVEGQLNLIQALADNLASKDQFVSVQTKLNGLANNAEKQGLLRIGIGDLEGNVQYVGGATANLADRPNYKAALEGRTIYSDPLISKVDGSLTITSMTPIQAGGRMQGVLVCTREGMYLSELLSGATYGETGAAYMINSEGTLVAHSSNRELVEKMNNIFESAKEDPALQPLADIQRLMAEGQSGFGEYTYMGITKYIAYVPVEGTGWSLAITTSKEEATQHLRSFQQTMLMVLGGILAVSVLLGLLVSNRIIKPLKQLTRAADQIAQGELDVHINTRSKDETGLLAVSIRNTVERLSGYIGYIQEITHVLENMAQGDMRVHLEQDYLGEFAPVKEALLRISAALSLSLSRILTSAEQVDGGSAQISHGAQALASGATEQASSIEELSASIAQVSVKADHNMKNVSKAVEYVGLAGGKVDESNQYMQSLQGSMEKIRSSSNEIEKIIKAIDNIAFQTNILALNASVEAARAGAAGKGFAVVADEVRNLAAKSAEAAKQTELLISASIESVNEGSLTADATAQALSQTATYARKVEEATKEIQADSIEQATAIAQITQGVEQISTVVQNNAATAEQSSASSEELSAQAVLLREEVNRFKLAAVSREEGTKQNFDSLGASKNTQSMSLNYTQDNTGEKY